MLHYTSIIFDFDGVILDSIHIRTDAFIYALREYPDSLIDQLIAYHLHNGGLSRFHKFQYFFDHILHQPLSEQKMQQLLSDFSSYVKANIINPNFIIKDTYDFILKNYTKQQFFIASGSEQNELRYICQELKIDHFFIGIFGSPIHKNQIVANIIQNYLLLAEETALIGDSINDLEAAQQNDIDFYGYNNIELKNTQKYGQYLENLTDIRP